MLINSASFATCTDNAPANNITVTCDTTGGSDATGVQASGSTGVTVNASGLLGGATPGGIDVLSGASEARGISLGDSAIITNTGAIRAQNNGTSNGSRAINGNYVTLTNQAGGTITSSVTNPGSFSQVFGLYGRGFTVVNHGSISASHDGRSATYGIYGRYGNLTNHAGATVSATISASNAFSNAAAVTTSSRSVTINNSGMIAATNAGTNGTFGIYSSNDGLSGRTSSITNNSGGTISVTSTQDGGGNQTINGITMRNGTVTNTGMISATATSQGNAAGIRIAASGSMFGNTITNNLGGSITGSNSGSGLGFGISFDDIATITNRGTVRGNSYSIGYTNGNGGQTGATNIVNSGTLIGNIRLTDGNNDLTLQRGTVFNVTVAGGTATADGRSGVNRLILENAATETDSSAANFTNFNVLSQGSGGWTLSGIISDGSVARSVTHDAAGTLTLSGNNTYSGGTSITGGTVIASADNNLGATSGGITFSNGSRLSFGASFDLNTNRAVTLNTGGGVIDTQNFNTTLGSVIGGTGGLTKEGAGTLTLTGNNTYTGSTLVNSGSLQLNGTSNSATVNVANGTLTLGAANRLSNSAALAVSGGIFDLSTFSDSVNSLALTGGSLNGTGTLMASTYDLQAGTVNANLGGTAAVTKNGAGTVTLAGTNSYSGGTTISGGTIIAAQNNALGTGAVANNGAVLQLGTTSALRSVAIGNFTQSAAGTLTITIQPSLSGGFGVGSMLNVSGSASVAGTLSVMAQGSGSSYQSLIGNSWRVINATGSVTGSFGTVTSPFLGFTQVASANAINLRLDSVLGVGGGSSSSSSTFRGVATTSNQRGVASALDNLAQGGTVRSGNRDAQDIINQLLGFSSDNARNAFEQIAGSQHASTRTVTQNSIRSFLSVVNNRAALGTSFVSALNDASASLLSHPSFAGRSRASAGNGDSCASASECRLDPVRAHTWIRSFGSFGNIDSDRNASGTNYTNAGVAVGIDKGVNDDQLLGLSLGYVSTNAEGKRNNSQSDIDSYNLAAYSRVDHLPLDFYTSGIVGYSYHDIQSRRDVQFGSIDRTLRSSQDNHSVFGSIETGKTFTFAYGDPEKSTPFMNGFQLATITPHVGLDYSHQFLQAFNERGGGFLNLVVGDDSNDSLRAKAGINFGFDWALDSGDHVGAADASHIKFDLDLAYAYEALDSTQDFRARLNDSTSQRFTVRGPEINRHYANVGAEISLDLGNQTILGAAPSFVFSYDGEYSTDITAHDITGGLRLSW